MSYLLLRDAHMVLAFVSLALFIGRGIPVVLLRKPMRSRVLKAVPHGVDTLLLASGVTLMVWSSQYPTGVDWLAVKVPLILLYIVLGVAAFRIEQPRPLRIGLFAAAIAVFVSVAAIAMTKYPLAPLSWAAAA